MAAKFTISDGESEPSEDLEEEQSLQPPSEQEQQISHTRPLTLPELRMAGMNVCSGKYYYKRRAQNWLNTHQNVYHSLQDSFSAPVVESDLIS